ncbi:MAG: diguanylate cyclase [Chloroflexota bacterium]|nr:diguanylate cyclase [Chloroflexota bacterium]
MAAAFALVAEARRYDRRVSTDPKAPLSLFEAARVLAHGGDLDSKLAALADHARSMAGAESSAVLLYDPEAGHLVTPDGLHTIDPHARDDALAAAIRDRQPVRADQTGVRPEIQSLLPSENHAFVPLVVEEESGPEIEGVLVLGLVSPDVDPSGMDAVAALADLAGVAIRQARLQNALLEQSSYHERLAHTDALTGLANRPTFEQMLELELARSTRTGIPLSVCLFEVDGLERLSEEHGAGAADDVLRGVAATLAAEVRLVDTVARIAGGQFGVLAPGEGGQILGERIRAAVASLDPAAVSAISVSIGVARGPENGASGSELLAAAQGALNEARTKGPGSLVSAVQAAAGSPSGDPQPLS